MGISRAKQSRWSVEQDRWWGYWENLAMGIAKCTPNATSVSGTPLSKTAKRGDPTPKGED